MNSSVVDLASAVKRASRQVAVASREERDAAILAAAQCLEELRELLLAANTKDLEAANGLLAAGEISQALYDRLTLTDKKLEEMAKSMQAVADLADPLGRILQRTELDSGLILEKVTCPLGVLAVIFEARPDAVTQITALALKSGNAVILKPGAEVEHTADALVEIVRKSLAESGLPADIVAMIKGRDAASELLNMSGMVDLVIPRGSKSVVEYVQANTRIPVLGHAEGICHVYVDAAADLNMALEIIDDAKTDYPAACNAAETVLVHESLATTFLPLLAERMRAKQVRLRGCKGTRAILREFSVDPVAENQWQHEYADLVLAVRVVPSIDEAISHIHEYGSSHTETIVTEDRAAAEKFLAQVDSAGVFHNASTRFADGYRYGLGAEVGISTNKLHARGPVGLEGLTTYKYVLRGGGQVARAYRGPDAKRFTHRLLPMK